MRSVVLLMLFVGCGGEDDTDTDTDTDTGSDSELDTEADTDLPTQVLARFDSETNGFSNSTVAVTLTLGPPGSDELCTGATTPAVIGDEIQIAAGDEGVYSYDADVDPDFVSVVACLTNGENDSATIVLESDSGIGYRTATEQGQGIGTPDLQGATITDIDIEITNIAVQNTGSVIYDVDTTTTIYGYPAEE